MSLRITVPCGEVTVDVFDSLVKVVDGIRADDGLTAEQKAAAIAGMDQAIRILSARIGGRSAVGVAHFGAR